MFEIALEGGQLFVTELLIVRQPLFDLDHGSSCALYLVFAPNYPTAD